MVRWSYPVPSVRPPNSIARLFPDPNTTSPQREMEAGLFPGEKPPLNRTVPVPV